MDNISIDNIATGAAPEESKENADSYLKVVIQALIYLNTLNKDKDYEAIY